MAKNKSVPKKLLLSRLDIWTSQHNLQQDPYLASVQKAIATSSGLDFWSSLEPEDYLPRPIAQTGSNFMKWAKTLSIVRNVAVFLPVGITWKAISEATTSFATFTSSESAAPVNFLEFWQNGYGYLDSKWRIGNVAEVDFWIVIAIIFITLLSSSLMNYGKKLSLRDQIKLDRERQVIGLELKSYFASPSRVSKQNVDETLARALNNLTSATEAISLAAMNLNSALSVEPEIKEIQNEIKSFHQRLGEILKVNRK
jgi:hypothetical protein